MIRERAKQLVLPRMILLEAVMSLDTVAELMRLEVMAETINKRLLVERMIELRLTEMIECHKIVDKV
jgi:hypothetical protein